ncbi:hypothetical protein [Kribbella catacumbae]|uniref:hypothetical protein n=1 Tax=Kribbella catacumbae TaxID=460086 RepID=UPI000366B038|nr:hypothetical protein [Kribbella catacumbae]
MTTRKVGACTQLTANDLMARRAPVYAFEFAEPRKGEPGEFPYGAHHGVDIQWEAFAGVQSRPVE